jgi:hypothetical protein
MEEEPKEKTAKEAVRANWTNELVEILLDIIANAMISKATEGNGFKPAQWAEFARQFTSTTGINYNRLQLQSKLSALKTDYEVWKKICDNSGFGWNEDAQLPTTSDDVWEAYIKAHPEAAKFRNTTLFCWKTLDTIFGNNIATGKYSQVVGQGPPPKVPDGINGKELPLQIGILPTANVFGDGSAGVPSRSSSPFRGVPTAVPLKPPTEDTNKKKRKVDQIASLLEKIIENQTAPTGYESAVKKFEKYSTMLSKEEILRIKRKLSTYYQEFLLLADEDEIQLWIRQELDD